MSLTDVAWMLEGVGWLVIVGAIVASRFEKRRSLQRGQLQKLNLIAILMGLGLVARLSSNATIWTIGNLAWGGSVGWLFVIFARHAVDRVNTGRDERRADRYRW